MVSTIGRSKQVMVSTIGRSKQVMVSTIDRTDGWLNRLRSLR